MIWLSCLNSTPNTLSIVIAYPEISCNWGYGIRVTGWFDIAPGELKTVYQKWGTFFEMPSYEKVYFYATDFRGSTWSGNELSTDIYPHDFNYCYGTQSCSDCEEIGMRSRELLLSNLIDDIRVINFVL